MADKDKDTYVVPHIYDGVGMDEQLKSQLINIAFQLIKKVTPYKNFGLTAMSIIPTHKDENDKFDIFCAIQYFKVYDDDMKLQFERCLIYYLDTNTMQVSLNDCYQVVDKKILALGVVEKETLDEVQKAVSEDAESKE